VSDLKSDRKTQTIPRFLASPHHLLATMHIDGHRLFAINMLGGLNRGLQVFWVQKGGRRNQYCLHIFRFQQPQVGSGAEKAVRCFQRRELFRPRQIIEVLLALLQPIFKELGYGDYPGCCVIDEGGCDVSATAAATYDPELNGGVGRTPEYGSRLQQCETSRCRGGSSEKISTVSF
jgi:hypothetical protein